MTDIASPPHLSNGVSNGFDDSPKEEQDSGLNGAYEPSGGDDASDDDIPWSARIKNESSKPESADESLPVKSKESKSSSKSEKSEKKSKKVLEEHKVKKTEVVEIVPEPKSEKRKSKTEEKSKKKKKAESDYEDDEYEPEPKKDKKKVKTEIKIEKTVEKKKSKGGKEVEVKVNKRKIKDEPTDSPTKRKKKVEEEEEVWRWWEEEKKENGIKWNTLEHKGPLFAPDYEPVPQEVRFKYDGKTMHLSKDTEEVASFYAKMLEHEYTAKDTFNHNFFKDWRKVMTQAERERITDLSKCNFNEMAAYFKQETEKRRNMSKEEKKKIKDANEEVTKTYGFALIDGHKQKIGNFRIEPPGLFRGRGDHPKMGKLKKRIQPEDVIINCAKKAAIPEPPEGHQWKEVRHDNTVTWLCSWSENVLGNNKYIMLNPSSKIKGEKDYEKFENARSLKNLIGDIRKQYTEDFKNREMRIRQRAVALYFIDKLALRAGNEKDTDEAADTVGCCSLRCEHVKLYEKKDDRKYVVEFDFLGKDSIRYINDVAVEKAVFKNLKLFKEDKSETDDLFDRLDTASLNAHLRTLMPNLTAKVFRTYNASHTLQTELDKLTNEDDTVHEKMLSYNRANRMVAVLCNHQRAVPKAHEKSMENLEAKIKEKKKELKAAKEELENSKSKDREKAKKKVDRIKEQLKRMKIQRLDRDENKNIALGTSKLNYLDPRISVAWCKKNNVPIEKVFNKTQREKFRWALEMTTEDYEF